MFVVIYDVDRRTDIIFLLDPVFVLPDHDRKLEMQTELSLSNRNARAMWRWSYDRDLYTSCEVCVCGSSGVRNQLRCCSYVI